MGVTLFHCTFSDRDMKGHVHYYDDSWLALPYVYIACIAVQYGNNTKVIGGSVVQTDLHHTDEGFVTMLVNNLIQFSDFKMYKFIPFMLQPFNISRLASDFPLEEYDYYELLFEKYIELTNEVQLKN